jgi:cell division protease FtsH
VVLILLIISIYQILAPRSNNKEITFTKFMQEVKQGNVKEVTIRGQVYQGKTQNDMKFKTVGLVGEKINKILLDNKVQVKYKPIEQNSFWQSIIISWLPILFLIVVFFLFMRQLQAGGGKAMTFGKSKAKLIDNHHKVTFNDVAGVDEAKEELEEVVQFLKDPKKFTRLGGRIPKGVLLMGSPGTGKTLLARAVAGEAGVPFFSISGSDFVEMFVGVGASRVRDLFEQGKRNAPCIIFIDEIDAVGRHRGAGLGGGHDEREQTLNQLLVEMDGFESNEGVILVAATNRPDVLDPALLRPGRFDRRVVVPPPDITGREQILGVHTRRTPLGDDVQLDVIARGTPGFSGADLENLVNEAALTAAREGHDRLMMFHFESARDKVIMGRERRSMILTEAEKKRTAVHEVGHALVSLKLPYTDPVHKVTVIPRGQALGVTMYLPNEDRKDLSKKYLENQIATAMGGRAADEIIYDEKTSGASQDIVQASRYARKMVCEWGMSHLGPLALGEKDEQIFLGREISRNRNYSEATAIEIDKAVSDLVHNGYKVARQILEDNIDLLKSMADVLCERESLSGEEVQMLVEGKTLPPFKKGDLPSARPSTSRKERAMKPADEENTTPAAPAEPTEPKEETGSTDSTETVEASAADTTTETESAPAEAKETKEEETTPQAPIGQKPIEE